MKYEHEATIKAISAWELRITSIIETGAGNRVWAIRWDMQGMNTKDNVGYYCYLHNLPYSMEEEIRNDLKWFGLFGRGAGYREWVSDSAPVCIEASRAREL